MIENLLTKEELRRFEQIKNNEPYRQYVKPGYQNKTNRYTDLFKKVIGNLNLPTRFIADIFDIDPSTVRKCQKQFGGIT